jgi:hypothetical protein
MRRLINLFLRMTLKAFAIHQPLRQMTVDAVYYSDISRV